PVLKEVDFSGAEKGGYVLSKDAEKPDIVLIASGSEVEMALKVKEKLADYKVNVVSLPSWELFDAQDEDYKETVIPSDVVNRASIELGSTIGWQTYVGAAGISIGVDLFGKSAPAADLMEDYDFTVDHMVAEVSDIVKRNNTLK